MHDVADLHTRDAHGERLAKIDQPKPNPTDQLLVIQYSHNMFRPALRIVNRDAGVLPFHHAVQGFIEHEIGRQGKNIGTGHHDFADGDVIQLNRIVDHFLLRLGDLPELAAGGDDELKFVRGVNGAAPAGFMGAESAQDKASGTAHDEE